MSPIDAFHDFFVASAGVAGALIGLLFVAVSVVPQAVRTSPKATSRLRPSAALSAFTNALLVSLLALVPGLGLAGAVLGLSIVGLLAMAALLVSLVREVRTARPSGVVWAFVAVAGQVVVYVFQLVQGLALRARPDDVSALADVAVLVVVLFALGIERAWEYVGANTPGLLAAILGSGRRPAAGAPSAPESAEPGEEGA